MKAMIFAAGVGSRLKPWTDYHPKALVEVGGEPMLGRVIQRLIAVGVDEIVVNVHHFASQIKEYLVENGNFGTQIHISDEGDRLLDTGGGLLKASAWLKGDEAIFLHNADIFCDVDLSAMLAHHTITRADATLLVSDRKSSRAFLFDSNLRLQGWRNQVDGRTIPAELHQLDNLFPKSFGGIHIINNSILMELSKWPRNDAFSITPFYAQSADMLDIRGYIPSEAYHWFDVGRMETLQQARKLMEK